MKNWVGNTMESLNIKVKAGGQKLIDKLNLLHFPMIPEESESLNCGAKTYAKIFDALTQNSNDFKNTDFESFLEDLKPAERIEFEKIISKLIERQRGIQNIYKMNPKEVFEVLFGCEPFELVTLKPDGRPFF